MYRNNFIYVHFYYQAYKKPVHSMTKLETKLYLFSSAYKLVFNIKIEPKPVDSLALQVRD